MKLEGTKVLWNKSYIFLIMVSLLTSMGFYMVYVMISNYAMEIDDSLALAGVISGIFSIAALVIRPLAGMSVDVFNKKYLCIIANLLMGFAVLGYAFSDQIPMLFLFRILHGIAFGLSSTTNIALISEFIPKERMGEGIGYYGIGQIIAQILGPGLGVYITEKSDFQSLFLLIAAFSFLAVFMLLLFPYPSDGRFRDKEKTKITIHSFVAKEAIMYALIGGMFSFSNGIVGSFLVLLGKERQIDDIGIFFSVGAIVLLIMRLFIGRVADRQRLTPVVNLSLFITAISMVLIGVAPVLSLLIIASILKSMGQGTGQITLQAECIKSVPPSRVGIAASTFYIGADIGQGLGPMIGGKISAEFGYRSMFLFCAALMITSLFAFNIYQGHKENGLKD